MSALAPEIRPDLIDTMMDLYCEWRTESKAVQAAYDQIADAEVADRAAAFAAYMAALDREESACRAYAAHVRMITRHHHHHHHHHHSMDADARLRRRQGDCR